VPGFRVVLGGLLFWPYTLRTFGKSWCPMGRVMGEVAAHNLIIVPCFYIAYQCVIGRGRTASHSLSHRASRGSGWRWTPGREPETSVDDTLVPGGGVVGGGGTTMMILLRHDHDDSKRTCM
jgi:hypothetical protein